MDDEAARKRVFVRNDRGQIRCPSFIVIANGGTCATAWPATHSRAPVLAREDREEKRGRDGGKEGKEEEEEEEERIDAPGGYATFRRV